MTFKYKRRELYIIPSGKKSRASFYVKWIKRFILVAFFFGLGSVAGLAAVFYHYSKQLPPIGPLLEGYDPPQTTRILAADGTVIGELFEERRTVVPIGEIPQVMIDAVVAAEDGDFWNHEGLDYMGMFRAMFTNVTSGRLAQGASTITQQVARTFFLSREKTFARKIKEILLTKKIEEKLTKKEILYLYLNQINFGHARYGVGEASKFYFSKDISELTVAEAALLAGIPKGPSVFEPVNHQKEALSRRSYVLSEMVKNGMLSEALAKEAKAAPLSLAKEENTDLSLAPEAVSRVLQELKGVVDLRTLKHGGYTVRTTLRPDLQRFAREAVLAGLAEVDNRHGRVAPFERMAWPDGDRGVGAKLRTGKTYVGEVTGLDDSAGTVQINVGELTGYIDTTKELRYNPKSLPPSKLTKMGSKLRVAVLGEPGEGLPLKLAMAEGPQGVLVALDPSSGSIWAMIGGDIARPGSFNRAIFAKRQPGSAFKPFVYLTALRTGRYSPASLLDDSPEVDGEWKPRNSHGDSFEGQVTMRDAIARSLNLPAIKLIREVGPGNVAELAGLMGVESKLDEGPALALGSSSVTPLELTSAYATIATGGIRYQPHIVDRVTKFDGRDIPLVGRQGNAVLTQQEAYVMTSMLRSVIDFGTGKAAQSLGRPAAGKTGTSNEARDAWFIGYTPDIAAGAWVGYDDPRPIGKKEYGGRAALPIWLDFMKKSHEGVKKRDFEEPPGIVTVEIDPKTGLLAYEGMENTAYEMFIDGTQPLKTALPADVVSVDTFMLEQAGLGEQPRDNRRANDGELDDAGVR